jgi:hypothetical protein
MNTVDIHITISKFSMRYQNWSTLHSTGGFHYINIYKVGMLTNIYFYFKSVNGNKK